MQQRLHMWRLLYNLCNNDVQLQEILTLVNEALAGTESLLRPDVNNEFANYLQDTFIYWLIEKMHNIQNRTLYTDVLMNDIALNKHIQQLILKACFENRNELFDRLISRYLTAIEQIHAQQMQPNWDSSFVCTAFVCHTLIMASAIDAEFQFEKIPLNYPETANQNLKVFLHSLLYAFQLSNGALLHTFTAALPLIHELMLHGDFEIKMLCLDYFAHVLRQTPPAHSRLDIEITYGSLVCLWQQTLHKVALLQSTDYFALEEQTSLILTLIAEKFSLPCFYQMAYEFHRCAAALYISYRQYKLWPQCLKINFKIMLNIMLKTPTFNINSYFVQTVEHMSQERVVCSRLLTINAAKQRNFAEFIAFWQRRFTQHEYSTPQLLEFLYNLLIAQHELMLQGVRQNLITEICSLREFYGVLCQQAQHLHAEINSVVAEYSHAPALLLQFAFNVQNLQNLGLRRFFNYVQQHFTYARHDSQICAMLLQSLTLCVWPLPVQPHMQEGLHKVYKRLLKSEQLGPMLCAHMQQLYAVGAVSRAQMCALLFRLVPPHGAVARRREIGYLLPLVVCTSDLNECEIFMETKMDEGLELVKTRMRFKCNKCAAALPSSELKANSREVKLPFPVEHKSFPSTLERIYERLELPFVFTALLLDENYACILTHLPVTPEFCQELMKHIVRWTDDNELELNVQRLERICYVCYDQLGEGLVTNCMVHLMDQLRYTLDERMDTAEDEEEVWQEESIVYKRQLRVLQLTAAVSKYATTLQLFYLCRTLLPYLMHPHAQVQLDAVQIMKQMCANHNIDMRSLFNCYKTCFMQTIVGLVVQFYLQHQILLPQSLKYIPDLLDFSCVREFVCKYYRIITAMLLPACVKYPQCQSIFMSIVKMTGKPFEALLVSSFLRAYTYTNINEQPQIANSCLEMIVRSTNSTLAQLFQKDLNINFTELLVYFNRKPDFVIDTFEHYIKPNEQALQRDNTYPAFHIFVGDRFLGIITHFESLLEEPTTEKYIKQEVLNSMGDLLRAVGSTPVTHYRFKITAMLSSVTLISSDLDILSICLIVWGVFLNLVNMAGMGSSLARIAVSLLPALKQFPREVNKLYECLILKNETVLSNFISELYFLQHIETIQLEVRKCVERYAQVLNNPKETVTNKLSFLYKQVQHENIQVRVMALSHLMQFVSKHRAEVNKIVLQDTQTNYFMEDLINTMIRCCWHKDVALQTAASKCLGELGAIDPSYMINSKRNVDRNRANQTDCDQKVTPLSVLTDDFALMALQELCRAYQFQKNSKFVDNFALAIQETLAVFGIEPKERKKLYLWEKLPEHVRQILNPLLNSSYTPVNREVKPTAHPIFNSSDAGNFEDWAFFWAIRLIDYIKNKEISALLSCYKPSIRRDNTTLATFLPFMLLHALQDCTEEQLQQIFEEFMAVFESNINQTVRTNNSETVSTSERNSAAGQEQDDDPDYMARTCCKLCAEMLDFLQRWSNEYDRRKSGCVGPHENWNRIKKFLKSFDKSLLARASYNANEYERALMYLEEYIDEARDERLQQQISFLLQIYGKLQDTDSVEGGLYMKKTKLNVEEQLLVYNIVDRTDDALMCYETLLSSNAVLNDETVSGIINCFKRMEHYETAKLFTEGVHQRSHEKYADNSVPDRADILWHLVHFKELDCLMSRPEIKDLMPKSWNLQLAGALLAFRKENNTEEFHNYVNNVRKYVLLQMHSCSTDLHQGYAQFYEQLLKLHLLTELEQAKALLSTWQANDASVEEKRRLLLDLFENWNNRLEIVRPVVRILETLIGFRRCLMQLFLQYIQQNEYMSNLSDLLHNEIGKSWLNMARFHRKAGHLQQAQLSLMRANDYDAGLCLIEKAKLLWKKNDRVNTFKLLEEYLQQFKDPKQLDKQQVALYFEAKLLQADYNAIAMHIGSEQIIAQYKEAIAANKESEKAYVHLAHYLEKLYDAMNAKSQDKEEEGHKLLLEISQCYAKSLRVGYEFVYESMPRLLSIWLDTTAKPLNRITRKMNDLVSWCANNLHPALFYVGLSQILSRLCHPQDEVFSVMRTILINLLTRYPQQTLWMMLPFIKSNQPIRVRRAKSVLTDPRLGSQEFKKLLVDLNRLVERLMELTNKELSIEGKHQISDVAPQLHQLFEDPNFSEILLPFERYMRPYFPSRTSSLIKQCALPTNEKTSLPLTCDPFPEKPVYIKGIKNEITILRSAAKPKKVCLICSDNNEHFVMLKPKDDLRRDFRLMEFNGLVQRYLNEDVEARQRRLHIRTYAAIPFNEQCGLVEWLDNLNSYRNICNTIYQARGHGIPDKRLREFVSCKDDTIEQKRDRYMNVLRPPHPPVFHQWLRQHFDTPVSWYEARSEYVKTLAVMSIVGYILGLGDRHGENVLFDEKSGDVVHVDFNCLFNHGETFTYPEVVPFRLTPNMVFALGPLGVEGMFRQCCEITLRLLKHESRSLLSVLRPFVYDTAQLTRQVKNKANQSMEATDPKAVTNVRRIEERLQGYVQNSRLPLSVKGQVDYLITEATSVDNLAAMYIGWGSFL